MKYALIFIFFFSFGILHAQSVFGKWKTFDDSGRQKSIVNIYEKNGKVFGDVVQILELKQQNKRCTECSGKYKNQPIVGMTILKNMVKKGDRFEGGTILDPENGKLYEAKIWLNADNPNILNVRGYMGVFYRTQNWVRLP